MYKIVSFIRQELLDKVWSAPLLKVCDEIGVSDVALGKACRKASIPLPGRGYWLKAEPRTSKPELPRKPDHMDEDCVRFSVLDEDAVADRMATKAALREKSDVPRLSIPETLVSPHRLIVGLQKAAAASKVDAPLAIDPRRHIDVRLSRKALPRALILLDALIKATEAMNWKWIVENGWNGKGVTAIECEGQKIEVSLNERLVRHEIERPPPRPRRYDRHGRWEPDMESINFPRYEMVSTDEFTFSINSYVPNCRKNWADTSSARLEEKLHDIVANLPVAAGVLRARELEQEASKRASALAEAQRVRAAREQEALRLLRAGLTDDLKNWERAERIRAFCYAVEQRLGTEDQAAIEWLQWARLQSDLLDPITSSTDGMLSLVVNVPESFSGHPVHGKRPFSWWPDTGTDEPEGSTERVVTYQPEYNYWRRR